MSEEAIYEQIGSFFVSRRSASIRSPMMFSQCIEELNRLSEECPECDGRGSVVSPNGTGERMSTARALHAAEFELSNRCTNESRVTDG